MKAILRAQNDIHHTRETLTRRKEEIKNSTVLLPEDRELILGYDKQMIYEGLSEKRREKVLGMLARISEWKEKPFVDCTDKDIKEIIEELEEKDYSEWYKHDIKAVLKKFYKFVRGTEDYPPEVSWIKVKKPKNDKLPEDLLTEEEVKRLIEASLNARDRALVSLLYESGARVEELLNLRIKNITFDEFGCVVLFEVGKTGARRIRIIDSVPYLAAWLDVHPYRKDRDAFLWVNIGQTNYGKPMDYGAVRAILKDIARRAGVDKPVNPHNFRHSRATFLAQHLTEAQLNEYLGWVQGSSVPQVYVHLSGRDVDDAILEMHGMKKEEKEEKKGPLRAVKCPRCGHLTTGKFCSNCGAVLTVEGAVELQEKGKEIDDLLANVLEDPEVKEILMKKLKEKLKE